MFAIMMPTYFIKNVLLEETNNKIHSWVTYDEFLRFRGIWLLMATTEGFQRRNFWSRLAIDYYTGALYRFGEYMSRNRFEVILGASLYTTTNPSTDKFWEVREMLEACNDNMSFFGK